MAKHCWICGKEIEESTVGKTRPVFHTEIRLVNVYRPINRNSKTKPVWVCGDAPKIKLG